MAAAAALCGTSASSAAPAAVLRSRSSLRRPAAASPSVAPRGALRRSRVVCGAFTVEIDHKGKKHVLTVDSETSILEAALDADLDMPHDCKLGVCMTCPARLLEGDVDQSQGMLSAEVIDKGFALMCSAYPRSDCKIKTIDEEELLAEQLST
eukprot:jgi/Chlat1/8195/Chrsp76S07632